MARVSLFVFFLLSHLLLLHSAEEVNRTLPNCSPIQCGKLGIIGFPFTDSSHPHCGLLPVKCDEIPPTIQLGWSRGPYEVVNISYTNTTLFTRIKDLLLSDALNTQKCESVTNFTLPNSPFISFKLTTPCQTLFKCNRTLNITSPRNFKNRSCGDYNLYYSHLNDDSRSFSSGECSFIQLPRKKFSDKKTLFSLVSAEFDLQVYVSDACSSCYGRGGLCELEQNVKFHFAIADKATSSVGIGVLLKKETRTHRDFEAFLRNYGPLAIRRYSYADIKTMTNSLNDKLGQGGYGSVLIKETKGNGEEFVNEVASISRTSHVNIVTLKGFCIEGSKRALIYELMPNGSLEKFIYKGNSSNSNHQLGWETLYKISIGIARGLEYLHRGCNTQILHFDIKPHNILLDENFFPKISDFGLAKICPREKSIISMVDARGTTGYIALEVVCRNFGEISHKSDVYSYGMMVLEMVGGRKNVDEGDEERARKMIIVSLWCIQTNPSNRPSMSRVVEMLEGSLNSLQIPPKPFLFSPPRRSPTKSSTIMVSIQ
ncbi:hypothetical protein ACJW31_08G129700 [Castanea mollissima]